MTNPNTPIPVEDPNKIENVDLKDISIHLHIQTIGAFNTILGSVGSGTLLIFVIIAMSSGIAWFNAGKEMAVSGGIISQICGGWAVFTALSMLMSIFFLLYLPYLLLVLISGIGLLKKKFWARILGIGLAGFQLIASIAGLFRNIFHETSSELINSNIMAQPVSENTLPITSIVISLLLIVYSVYILSVLTSRRAEAYFRRNILSPKQ